MNKKEIQMKRMMGYFIDAASDIIEKEGVEHVTIRKVADIAGYNSATIYNYFGELSHLIFFAAMRSLKKYSTALPKYIEPAKDPLERYLLIWECFCKYSYKEPQIYHALFTSNLGCSPEQLFNDYYVVSPEDFLDLPANLKPMFKESILSKRGKIALEESVKEGLIEAEQAEEINEHATLIWQGMHTMMLNNRVDYTSEEATNITMKYIKAAVNSIRIKI
ncbi:TetR/AcrR family transcriptional regulator [Anaerobacillus sp. MEB173]|uniref:TetR/AcrR family transcriptional regulator n=1 Tax=Anaerobacillus sp. MEB173 TaxID=3383345 RepID=UPI003F906CD3